MIASTAAMNSADLADVFQGIDKDGSGTLNRSEIEAAFKGLIGSL